MALAAKMQMRQTQSLVMTPQLLQSIRLLQYSHFELRAFVDAEMERNPLLVADNSADGTFPAGDATTRHNMASLDDFDPRLLDRTGGEARADRQREAALRDETRPEPQASRRDGPAAATSYQGRTGGRSLAAPDGDFGIEDIADRTPGLHAHVLAEVADALPDRTERRVGEALVEHLDDSGYLQPDFETVARELGVDKTVLSKVRRTLQRQAHPAGLFARSLGECLALQLERRDRLDPVMRTVLDNLDLLARRDFAALRRLTGEDESGLMDILAEIRGLDPKPGHAFSSDGFEAIIPDVLVTEAPDGGWTVELNPDALPRVLVDNDYLTTVRGGALSEDERNFIGDCQQSANWLVRSLDQRAKTIVKVASEIVRRQDGFLTKGVGGLKPMTLMAVAEAIGMHESTVSRVTATKFIATPRGTFDMRFFFTVAIASANGGDAHSAESVKHRVKQMIDAETVGKVLSDDDIAVVLKKEGVDLARRTVAKYREALGLPSSIQRRRELNARRLAS